MRFYRAFVFCLSIIAVTVSCQRTPSPVRSEPYTIREVFQTQRHEKDNVDSPSVWHGPNTHWLISTAKSTDVLIVNDASTGAFIKRVGETGSELGQFKRPNGIFVIDDYVFVVERDNRRVQVLALPDFNPVGILGDSLLIKPYGLFVYKQNGANYALYVTDNYETENEKIPPDSALGNRIVNFSLTIEDDRIDWKLVRRFGATEGPGVLRIVESICGDPTYNKILISEEDESQSSVKVYDLDGGFTGIVFGLGVFHYQVEGIALYQRNTNEGYWIVTDQSYEDNRFHVFERKNFKYWGSFKGSNTANTDGIWLTQSSFGPFQSGAFYAVHDDGNVSAFDFTVIADSLSLSLK